MSIDPTVNNTPAETDAFAGPDWISYEDADQAQAVGGIIDYRQVDGLFGCGNVAVTVEGRVDRAGTIPFVAVRTDSEAFLDVDGIDRLVAVLAAARKDLVRVVGGLQ